MDGAEVAKRQQQVDRSVVVPGRGPVPFRECGPDCDINIDWATHEQRWERLTFMHWAYDPAIVQRLLPSGLTVETFDGAAWVALVPFSMRVNLPRLPAIPWLTCFPETNVRTYAVDASGRNGVWFLSLDASNLGAVVVARGSFGLPYYWSRMKVRTNGDRTTYRSRRTWPGPYGVGSDAVVRSIEPLGPHELGSFDHWLTARFMLYANPWDRGLHTTYAEHGPWPLQRAEVLYLRDGLVEATGLPAPEGEPIAHYSSGVDVRISWPHRVRPLGQPAAGRRAGARDR